MSDLWGTMMRDWRDDLPMALSVGALAGHRYARAMFDTPPLGITAPLDMRRTLALAIIKAIRSQPGTTCEATMAHIGPEVLGPLPTFCLVDGYVDFLNVADKLLAMRE